MIKNYSETVQRAERRLEGARENIAAGAEDQAIITDSALRLASILHELNVLKAEILQQAITVKDNLKAAHSLHQNAKAALDETDIDPFSNHDIASPMVAVENNLEEITPLSFLDVGGRIDRVDVSSVEDGVTVAGHLNAVNVADAMSLQGQISLALSESESYRAEIE